MPYKRGKTWYLDYIDENGSRHREPWSTSKEATIHEEEIRKRKVSLLTYNAGQFGRIHWDDFKTLLSSKLYPKRKKSTVVIYKKFISLAEQNIHPSFLSDITPPKVEDMRLKCLKDGMGPHAVERYIKGGFAIFTWAWKNDLIQKIEWKSVENTHLDTNPPVFLSLEDFKKVANAWDPANTQTNIPHKAQLYLFALTCRRMMMRPSEAWFARWDLTDLNRGEYKLSDDKSHGFEVKVHSYRTLPIPPMLLSYLRKIKLQAKSPYWIEWSKATSPRHPLKDGRPMAANSFFKIVSKELTKLGYKDATAYSFRHTGATYMVVQTNESLTTTGKIMGHKSQKTTQIYVHPVTEDMRRAVNKLESSEYNQSQMICVNNCENCSNKNLLLETLFLAQEITKKL